MTMTPARLNFRLSQVLLERVALLEPQNAAEIAGPLHARSDDCIPASHLCEYISAHHINTRW